MFSVPRSDLVRLAGTSVKGTISLHKCQKSSKLTIEVNLKRNERGPNNRKVTDISDHTT
jgi:hypothetical protein